MAKDSREKIRKKRRRRRKRRLKLSVKIFLFVFVCCCGMGGYGVYRYYQAKNAPDPFGMISDLNNPPPNTYEITDDLMEDAKYWVLDAGEGEAIYVKSGNTDILIDTGKDKKAKGIIKPLKDEITDDLDYLIITNTSYRRTGGLVAVYKEFHPKNIITCELGDMETEIKEAVGNAPIQKGESTTITISKNSSFTIFKPEVSSTDPNDKSLMTYFKYGDTAFFAESDAGEEEESRVINRITRCETVVLARAGSDDVNQHVKDINASSYIVSTSKETGLPSDKLLEGLGSNVYATYDIGTIKFSSNGTQVESNLEMGNNISSQRDKAAAEAEANAENAEEADETKD